MLYVQELDISKFTNSIILTALKGRFPNLVKLAILLCEWKDEHMNNLFTGMTKLECLDIKWDHSKIMLPTFFDALNDVVDTLKNLGLWNMKFHTDDLHMKFNKYHLNNSSLPVCINSN